jgi:hypothetical protein
MVQEHPPALRRDPPLEEPVQAPGQPWGEVAGQQVAVGCHQDR